MHRQAVRVGALVAGPRSDRAQRSGALRPGRGGAERHRRDLLPARRRRDRAQRLGAPRERAARTGRDCRSGRSVVAGLAAGLAAGTKLNFLLPCGGARPRSGRDRAARVRRWRALGAGGLAALAGGGYWYLRNLVHTGNPLPWFDSLGPISLPAPDQALGGREAHSVLGYLTDGSVWSDWFLPGLHDGLGSLWPLLGLRAGRPRPRPLRLPPLRGRGGRPRCLARCWRRRPGRPRRRLAWLVAPTSASGPDGMPRGSSPASATWPGPGPRPRPAAGRPRCCAAAFARLRRVRSLCPAWRIQMTTAARRVAGWAARASALALVAVAIAVGYVGPAPLPAGPLREPDLHDPGPERRLQMGDADLAAPGSRPPAPASTRSSAPTSRTGSSSSAKNAPTAASSPRTCRPGAACSNEGDYDYVVASRDRIEPGKPPTHRHARWTEAPAPRSSSASPPRSSSSSPAAGPSTCPCGAYG